MTGLFRHNIVGDLSSKDLVETIVEIIDFDCGNDEKDFHLIPLIKQLQDALESIPKEFQESAVLRISASGDYVHVFAGVNYYRPETDEEFTERQSWLDSLKENDEERERREFERLKEKFKCT